MGIREKRGNEREGITRWKMAAAYAFLLWAAFSTSFCHADSEDVTKDTSWFDYENPKSSYTIHTEAELMGFASLVNEEQTDRWKPDRVETFEGVTFTLARDIILTRSWTPIGKGGASSFAGTFDGNGHTISNVRITANTENSGFFGSLSGEVKDLHVSGKITSEYSACGGIAGHLDSSAGISGCTNDITISGKDMAGGIVGYNEGGTIEGCINTGEISGTHKVGGIVGENWGGKITECGNKGSVISARRGFSTYGTGGVAGRSVASTAEISKSYNTGEIHSYTEGTGGVVGYANAKGTTIKDCYNTGNITIIQKKGEKETSEAYAGGIAGIAGINGVVIKNCYNTGIIQNADAIGGIIGFYDNGDDGIQQFIFNNYYLKNSKLNGIGKAYDMEDPNLPGAVSDVTENSMNHLHSSLSVSYMKDNGVYGNNGYPVLTWQQPVSDEEQEKLLDIPEEKRKMLNEYMRKYTNATLPGQIVLKFFQPDNTMSNAFILYMDAKDKITNQTKDVDKYDE